MDTTTATPQSEPLPLDTSPRRAAVIVNPNRIEDVDGLRATVDGLLAEAGWPAPTWIETTAEDPGTGQARQAVDDGAEVVLVSGGDGTVRAVVEGLVGSDVALGVIPGGTGNLLAQNLGVPVGTEKSVQVVLDGARRRIDVGETDGQVFAVMAGTGLDAAMMDDAPAALKARLGPVAYVVSAFKHLRDDEMHVEVQVDDGPVLRRRARTVVVGNVGMLGGGVTLLTEADAANGTLEVAILAPRNLGHWVQLLVGVLVRSRRVPRMEVLSGAHVVVTSDREHPRQIDGDVVEPSRTLDVRVRPGTLLVCVPEA